jgi:transcriptional antiterminator RfaH
MIEERRWIAIHTQQNAELKAEHHLRRQGYRVYLPKYLRQIRHARRIEQVIRPLFPRYLFVELSDRETWRPMRSTVGVSALVCAGEHPAAVPEAIIARIRARENDDGLVRLNDGEDFHRGEIVHVELGSFSGLDGIFECCDDRERVTILLNILGRQVRARLPLEAIRAGA